MFSSISTYYPLRLHVVVRFLSILLSLLLNDDDDDDHVDDDESKTHDINIKINKMIAKNVECSPFLCTQNKNFVFYFKYSYLFLHLILRNLFSFETLKLHYP